jgi:8-oxo-dGTP diphosphatase
MWIKFNRFLNKFTVSGVVIRDKNILLVRHTYGFNKDKLHIPGGYVAYGEMPRCAALREIREETGIISEVDKLIAIRFAPKNWWAVFALNYKTGESIADGKEIKESIFLDIQQALKKDDVTETSKHLIIAAMCDV